MWSMNKRQKIAVVILNILIIAELFISMYLAHKDPENFSLVFFKYLLMMLIPTFIIGKRVIRRLGTKEPHPGIPDYLTEERVKKALPKRPSALTREVERPKIFTGGDIKLAQASKWRGLAGKAAAVFFVIVLIAILDSCQAKFRHPIDVINILPGTTKTINGTLSVKVKDVSELTYVSSSDLIQLTIREIYSGFWFGAPGWSGLLQINSNIEPGEYTLTVIPRVKISEKPPFVHYIRVYRDQISYRKSSTSIIKQYSGVSPVWILVFVFPLAILSGVTVLFLSRRIEHLLLKSKKAEVYLVREGLAGYEIAFSLGRGHGIKPGDRLTLLDEGGRYSGTVEVQEASVTDSIAIAGFDTGVKIGFIVSLDRY